MTAAMPGPTERGELTGGPDSSSETAGGADAVGSATALVRALARATNRVLAGTEIAVHGDGATADAVVDLLEHAGSRVLVSGSEPERRERHRRRGRRTSVGGAVPATTTVAILVDTDLDVDVVAPSPATLTVVATTGRLLGLGGVPADPLPRGMSGYRQGPGVPRDLAVLTPHDPDRTSPQAPTRAAATRPGGRRAAARTVPAGATRSDIRDPSLWREGEQQIAWAFRHMPVTAALAGSLREAGLLPGRRIALNLVLEPKTAALALALAEGGAEVAVGCHASSTRDEIAAALVHAGVTVFSRSDADAQTDHALALALLDTGPDVLVDDGSSVLRLAHAERPAVLAGMLGATEETTSGLRPLRVMAAEGSLAVPVIAANDARCKTLFDNGIGTGESCMTTIVELLDAPVAGAHVVVAGFGYVGRGVARVAAALGGRVTVTEVDPVAALEAVFAGYDVAPLAEAARTADLLVSATGIAHTVALEHLRALPSGAAVAVAGGVPEEVEVAGAERAGARLTAIADGVELLALPSGPAVRLLDHGRCINCSAGDGNPIEIMDLSFGVQLAAIEHLLRHAGELAPGVHALPADADRLVATTKLAALGVGVDHASPAQLDFLARGRS